MATIRAPFSRARSTNGHMCGFDVSVFVPQSNTRSLSGMPSTSAPMFAPTVMRMPTVPAVEQIVRASASNDGGLRHVQSGLAVKQAFAIRVFPRLSQRKLRPNSLTLIPENLVYRTPEPRTSERVQHEQRS